MSIDWGKETAVVIIGLVVVFAVLLILVLLCNVTGSIFKKVDNNKKAKLNSTKNEKAKPKASSNIITKSVANVVPAVEEGITDDVVAAIAAAIACIMGNENKFAVKSIKRARGSRPAWNTAGILENTRPF